MPLGRMSRAAVDRRQRQPSALISTALQWVSPRSSTMPVSVGASLT